MFLCHFAVYCVNTCRALLGVKSRFETILAGLAIVAFSGNFALADETAVQNKSLAPEVLAQTVQTQMSAHQSEGTADQLLQSLKKDSVAIRRDGETIRMRFLRGSKDLAPAIRDLQLAPHKLFEKNFNSALGPGSSGGSFSNYYGSYAKTMEDVQAMINQFSRMPESLLKDYLPPQYKNLITNKKIIQALEKIRISFFQEGLSVAPNGMVDILEADYVIEGQDSYIILLKSFFEKYNSIVKDDQLSFLRSRVILHEISHLFGIGTVKDKESWQLSFYLLLALTSENRFCVSTDDCVKPVTSLRKQYQSATYELERTEILKKEIEETLNLSELKLNAVISHGLMTDVTSGYTTWKISKTEALNILVPSDLRHILPDEFKDMKVDSFGAELLASLSYQKNISFENFVSQIKDKKSRISSYSVIIYEGKNGILYSKKMPEQNWNNTEEQKRISAQFFQDRGECYGEKIERSQYVWTFDSQNKICVGIK